MAPKSVLEIEVSDKVVPISNPDKVYFPTRGETKIDLVNYYLALVGDSADGFPGLVGWGSKSAAAVLAKFKHIEQIPAAGEEWGVGVRNAGRLAAALREEFELALLFRRIATIESDADVVSSVDEMEWKGPKPELVPLAEKINGLGLAERAIKLAKKRATS